MAEPTESDASFRAFVDDYRPQCLWFLAPDYYPTTPEEHGAVLRLIELHGDRAAFLRAAGFRQWLSRLSNVRSVTS